MNKKPGKNKARDLGFYALLLVILIAMIFSFNKNDTEVGVIGYSELRDHFLNEEVVSFVAEGNVISATLKDESKVVCELSTISIFY
ncbi:MAG: hypothetical protein IJY96_03460, partial [Oscillospiraceae bacterium]|nr:hypothetical protein [Oscillospiraceae bacterium]